MNQTSDNRTIGLVGATGVGVGAIVGGGILALAGVAFATTGPGAIVAFALNGLIALLTALSFAEMSAAFPESGGTYTFAKKVLSVRAAFTVGWIVWFASIVAAVLYAIGFATFGMIIIGHLWQADYGVPAAWLTARWTVTTLALGATCIYTLSLMRQSTGGGQWANFGKVVVFVIVIVGGLWALPERSMTEIKNSLDPIFTAGALGLFQAMGYTFIALQGFDLIAAVAGEVRDPGRTIPKAMLLSLGTALAIYLPLLFVIVTVGTPVGQFVVDVSLEQSEAIVAVAAQNYLGHFGYWLVMVAAVLSMLSALRANLYAASRMAMAMARDRTLPHWLEVIHEKSGTPVLAIFATGGIVLVLLLVLSDVAAAGAVSSLIFLITFTLAHGLTILARRRTGGDQASFRVPWSPFVPLAGALACLSLAVFQGIVVPSAGVITIIWLGFGAILYFSLFSRRARVVDASAEALYPKLVQLRGRSPLVLVPIANPANAEALVAVANSLCPPKIGRVLLLSVVQAPDDWQAGSAPPQLVNAQAVLGEALTASFAAGLSPEALTTVASPPWTEISRVARTHRCESMVLGLTHFTEEVMGTHLEDLMSTVDCHFVILRAPKGWRLSEAQRVLVPIGGRRVHNELRARLLGSLWRMGVREIKFLQILAEKATDHSEEKALQGLIKFARDEVPGQPSVQVVRSNAIVDKIMEHAMDSDLVVLGLQRLGRRRKVFSEVVLRVARNSKGAVLIIGSRG
ncbi:amino acid permease [bacterium]|nr:amino acid permease [bacterium]